MEYKIIGQVEDIYMYHKSFVYVRKCRFEFE